MDTKIVRHIKEDRNYELHMIQMPEEPQKYFNETIVDGFENWVWTGPGTAVRNNYPSKEWAQITE